MKLLVLGGTRFVGRAVVETAVADGWDVTTFNRGSSGVDIPGEVAVHGDRTSTADLDRLTARGPWDAVIDTSGFVPSNVLDVASVLRTHVGCYVFMSSVSVYAGWPRQPLTESSETLWCPPDADETYGEDVEDGPTRYGYQKSGCEAAVREVFGEDGVCLRPGVILGPYEYVGRLPWWLRRVAAGGRVVAPGSPDRSIQPVDARDVARFALLAAERPMSTAMNVAAPIGRETFGGMLDACAEVTGSTAEFVWVPDKKLLDLGVRQWSELPLWRTFPGVWQVASDVARANGLSCRPLTETVADTWKWLSEGGAEVPASERAAEIGLSRDREEQILAAVA